MLLFFSNVGYNKKEYKKMNHSAECFSALDIYFSLKDLLGQCTVVGPSWSYSWHEGEEMEKPEMIPQGNRQAH